MSRALYYPDVDLIQTISRFGAIETSPTTLYQNPIKNKHVFQIDTLNVLEKMFTRRILMSRELTYMLISGSCTDERWREIMVSYYTRFDAFAQYVNDKVLFSSNNIATWFAIIDPLRTQIDTYAEAVMTYMADNGAKFLMRTHDYLYYATPKTREWIPDVGGVKVIC